MTLRTASLAVVLSLAGARGWAQSPADLREAMLVAEDLRGTTDAELAPLWQGLASQDPVIRERAVRALGRFERASFVARLAPFLDDPVAAVRAAAAHALGQTARDSIAVSPAAELLRRAAAKERDPLPLGALARSLGRLRYQGRDDALAARAILVELAGRPGPLTLQVDVTRAIFTLGRAGGRNLEPAPELVARLRELTAREETGDEDPGHAAAVRRAALEALTGLGRVDEPVLRRALEDPDPEVRRLGVLVLADSTGRAGRPAMILAALNDRSPMVRLEAVRSWSRQFQGADCEPLVRALSDRSFAVRLEAIDRLGNGCSTPGLVRDALRPLVDSLTATSRQPVGTIASWHRGAHALVALARTAPDLVRPFLNRAANHVTWQVRMYAARAAALVGDADRLLVLATDGNDNVREAAIDGLTRVRGPAVPAVYRAQLARSDYQLLITAARALEGTPDRPAAISALLGALARVTRDRKETSRDTRIALLERIVALAGPEQADALRPYLGDFDPEIARRAAAAISRWTETPLDPAPRRLAPPGIRRSEIEALWGARLRLTMSPTAGGGTIDIALDPDVAPVTVARIARLATAGYYDGRTFHRVVPNFVIQGGSPGANEYAGDGPYLRDEIGPGSHERGTLGISTRGRDTGDAQIFVNLVENLRLDFDYTVWGRVVSGMDLVDAILEGDEIERADVVK